MRVYQIELRAWLGERPAATWQKPIVGPRRRPFAELQIVEALEKDGWSAGWVYRPGKFLSTWEPGGPSKLPEEAIELHSQLMRLGTRAGGCWDIYAWRDRLPLFLEVKRAGSSDRIRVSQGQWLEVAIAEGVRPDRFALVEWHLVPA
jgi:hypothetical protein